MLLHGPGNKVGHTRQGIQELIDRDRAVMERGYRRDRGGQAFSPYQESRIVPIGVIDQPLPVPGSKWGERRAEMVNIYGYSSRHGDITRRFDDAEPGKAVIGRVMTIPATGASSLNNQSTFLRSIILVR